MAYNLASAAMVAGVADTQALAQQDALANTLVAELKAVIDDLRSAQQDELANALIAELKTVIDDLRSDPDHCLMRKPGRRPSGKR
jgi:hypothetical protein